MYGIFTYMTGSFMGQMLVNIPAPWIRHGMDLGLMNHSQLGGLCGMGPRRRRWHFGPRAMALWAASPALLVPGPGGPDGAGRWR
jgi:hypothetical protein